MILIAGGRAGDDTDGATGMHQGIICAANFDQRHDLCSGVNVVRLVRHFGRDYLFEKKMKKERSFGARA
jgi:hypothetical protein